MKQEIKERFESICEANDKIIQAGINVVPFCFVLKEGQTHTIVLDYEKDKKEEYVRDLKKFLLSEKIEGYVIINDCKMTITSKTDKPSRVVDAVVRSLYTVDESMKDIVVYENAKITRKNIFSLDRRKGFDEWDVWGGCCDEENPQHKKICEDHWKFREENPEKYKEEEDGK